MPNLVGGLSSIGRLSVEASSRFLQDKGFESEITDSLKGMVGLIKCPTPRNTKFIKFPPSRVGKDVKWPGYAPGGGGGDV